MTLLAVWFSISTIVITAVVLLSLPFRGRTPNFSTIYARTLHFGAKWLCGWNVRVLGGPYLNRGPSIYICNHQSNLDPFTIGGVYPWNTIIIGKKELKKVPFFGFLFWATGNVYIDRKDRTNSIDGLNNARDAVLTMDRSVWIFPEGTRNRGSTDLLPFKKGAFHLAMATACPIVPIVQSRLSDYYDSKRGVVIPGEIVIEVLPPIAMNEVSADQIPAVMEKVRSQMLESLNRISKSPASHS